MCNLVSQCGSNIKLIIDKIHQKRNNLTNKEMQFSYPNYCLKAIKNVHYALYILFSRWWTEVVLFQVMSPFLVYIWNIVLVITNLKHVRVFGNYFGSISIFRITSSLMIQIFHVTFTINYNIKHNVPLLLFLVICIWNQCFLMH